MDNRGQGKSNTENYLKRSDKMSYYPQLPRESFQHLRESWIAYVNVERKKDGMGWDLPKGRRCDCGKSRTSYPHWPPTSQTEAIDQLKCLLGQSYPHRQYLAHCWMVFLLTDDTEKHKKTISLVHNSCPVLQLSENETPKRRRVKMDCAVICQPVLDAKSSHCLCGCWSHREECPVHRCY